MMNCPDIPEILDASVRPVLRPALSVCRLFISPGHNFVGHHGGPPGTHPTIEVEHIECVAGSGIRGDRYFEHEKNYRGQITFFALEVFRVVQKELGLSQDAIAAARRNVITEGIDLNTLIGCEFEIQGVNFAGVEECRPCYWMNYAWQDPRAESTLKGQGGLRARILTNGTLRAR
jgi:hypothetical protein